MVLASLKPVLFKSYFKNTTKSKYNPVYIKFVATEHRRERLPERRHVGNLSDTSMKPHSVKRHLESNQTAKNDRDQSYFQRPGEKFKRQRMEVRSGLYKHLVNFFSAGGVHTADIPSWSRLSFQ